MQVKNSPAPWRAVHSGEEKPIYIYSAYSEADKEKFPYSNGRLIAAVFNLSSYSQQVNAALMAKAPELFEAAETALRLLRGESAEDKEAFINELGSLIHEVNILKKTEDIKHES
ncbi:phage portal protein [Bacillus sp. L381]|uniref:phage portal protein n=1 Tax=Bacillus TaxID=1386 RepID=UPI001BA7FC23|nr:MULTISPECIES: phage portal protein [Bacillus]MCR9037780.1 phage portal protein [Bacillus velezensis]QUN10695.1 phage portal protein [Bacillus amyloliquefaciens]QYM83827.1 phage portal protein [Bacillus sp. 7D3]QZY13014.1 phage portal protein [Bacillus amyloliquefaciens]WIX22827.1 phage portal protein [Bacillus sp. L381]